MSASRTIITILTHLFLPGLFLLMPAISFADEVTIAIISNNKIMAYQKVVNSFKLALSSELPKIKFVGFDDISAPPPKLVFALGNKAVRQWYNKRSNIDLIATMILNNKLLQEAPNASSIQLTRSALNQLQWHQKIIPNSTSIGILYDPKYNQAWIEQAQAAAFELGLNLIAVPVFATKDIGHSLKIIGRQADSIFGIPDKTVYSSKTAQKVLLFSYNNRIPFVGLSGAWAKAGAIYALDWDYDELGRQSAKQALKILKGEKHTTQPANKTVYQLNLKTAKHIKLNLAQDIIDGAAKVYQ